jgi:hypothetical protein
MTWALVWFFVLGISTAACSQDLMTGLIAAVSGAVVVFVVQILIGSSERIDESSYEYLGQRAYYPAPLQYNLNQGPPKEERRIKNVTRRTGKQSVRHMKLITSGR